MIRSARAAFIVLRGAAVVAGAAVLWYAVDTYSAFAPDLGMAKAAVMAGGLLAIAAPLLWAGLSGRGVILIHVERRLIRLSDHVKWYHSDRRPALPEIRDGNHPE
jgi:hypothetical protein